MAEATGPVRFEDVEEARRVVRPFVVETPCRESRVLSERTGVRVHFKMEHLQMTGSYKERGACFRMSQLTEEERARGVIAFSAGNHAQGVAYHAKRLGIAATIVMPVYTPLVKVEATRRWGAEVVLFGQSAKEARDESLRLGAEQNRTYIHPFDDPAVVAGQGTVGLELIEQNPYLDAVIVPVGGGGLIAGMALALKETNPRIRVYGVEAIAMPAMLAALKAGRPVDVPSQRTLAEGIAVARVGDVPFALAKRYVDDVVTVDDEEIAAAILMLLEVEKTMVEGSGAAGLAALLSGKLDLAGKRTAIVLTGGNIDVTMLARIIERGLVKNGRHVRLAAQVLDAPGSLARVTGIIAGAGANILEIHHERAFSRGPLGVSLVEFTVETRGHAHIAELVALLEAADMRVSVR
jgi:threonine dehydratase